MFHVIIGWIGGFLFAICTFPQAVKTYRTKSATDLSWWMLILWLAGEILTLIYIGIDDYITGILHLPLHVNYLFNIAIASYLIFAKIKY